MAGFSPAIRILGGHSRAGRITLRECKKGRPPGSPSIVVPWSSFGPGRLASRGVDLMRGEDPVRCRRPRRL